MKLLFKLVTILHIFLLGGFLDLHAADLNTEIFPASDGISLHGKVHFTHTENVVLINYPLTFDQNNKFDDVRESEDETEETNTLKKYTDAKKYFACIFCTGLESYLQKNSQSGFTKRKHYAYYSSGKQYIIFRVIRL